MGCWVGERERERELRVAVFVSWSGSVFVLFHGPSATKAVLPLFLRQISPTSHHRGRVSSLL